jgi:hypothetical protein
LVETNNVCEKIQIAIMSDESLTSEQLEHIENCDECRALLLQINEMKSSLCGLSLPEIREGQITESVMGKIRKEKSVPFPAVKFTRHIGTAASLLIICVIAFALKDNVPPVAPDTPQVIAEETSEDYQGFTVNGSFGVIESENEEAIAFDITEESAPEVVNDTATKLRSTPPETEEVQQAPILMKSIRPSSASQEGYDVSDAIICEEAYDEEMPSEAEGSAVFYADNSANEFTEESATNTTEDKGNYGGSSGGGISEEYIFSSIPFIDGEENLDYNISLANKKLTELESDVTITREKLSELGFGNEFFIEKAKSITLEELTNLFI